MRRAILTLLMMATAAPAWADGTNLGPDSERFLINMTAPALCRIGEIVGENGEFDVGILTEAETGLLRRGLSAPTRRLQATFCNSPSEIRVEAVLMTPTTSNRPAPQGFSRGVHFTATVSGWTDDPAVFETDIAGDQAESVQRLQEPRQTDLIVSVSDFRTAGGATLLPVASSRYQGQVIVTLGPLP